MKHLWFTCSYSDSPDAFRLDEGYHNGPECERCGRMACEHCEPGIWDEECPA